MSAWGEAVSPGDGVTGITLVRFNQKNPQFWLKSALFPLALCVPRELYVNVQ